MFESHFIPRVRPFCIFFRDTSKNKMLSITEMKPRDNVQIPKSNQTNLKSEIMVRLNLIINYFNFIQ